jgi:hypothetical protein
VRNLNNPETGEITADHEAYIETLLAQYNMTNCNPNMVPMKTSVHPDEIASHLPKTTDRGRVSLYCIMTNANHELYTLAKGKHGFPAKPSIITEY